MTISKYFIIPIVLLSMTISSCLNGVQERNNENNRIADSLAIITYNDNYTNSAYITPDSLILISDIFARLVYPKWMKQDFSNKKYSDRWTPFPALNLNKKTLQEITKVYGNPFFDEETIFRPGGYGEYGDLEIDTLLSNIQKIEIKVVKWEIKPEIILVIYFLNDKNTFKAFYGYKYKRGELMEYPERD